MSSLRLVETIRLDTLYALRTLRKNPALSLTAVLTLALAIGGNTAMFTVIHSVLLKPLPYPDSDQLVRIWGGATTLRYEETKRSARSFGGVGAFAGEETPTLSGRGDPEALKSVRVSANFLQILGVNPLLGRSFLPTEDSPSGPPVAMISAELWARRFDRDPGIVGKTAVLAEVPYTIIGVLPPHFSFPFPDVTVWITSPSEWPLIPPKSRATSPFLSVFGRLKPGISLPQARSELQLIQHRYAAAHPTMLDAKPKKRESARIFKDDMVADVRSMLWVLLGAVGFVLLIACANLAALMLARGASRGREIAVRSALGAAPPRLIAQLVSESLALSICGGMVGVLLAFCALRAIPQVTAMQLPRAQDVRLDWIVLAFAAALSITTGVVFGLGPAVSASRFNLIQALRVTGGDIGSHAGAPAGILSRTQTRGLLLIAQIALSIVLLIGTALLVQSVARMRGVNVGFQPENLLTAEVSLPPSRYDTSAKKAAFFRELVGRLKSTPGIQSAAASMSLPMMGYAGTPVQDAAKPLLKLNERLITTISIVTPGYFRTLQIPLRRGRDFSERDLEGTQRVAIIDEALARRFWPAYPGGLDPIGQRLWVGGSNPNPAEIVGIAADVHQTLDNTAWPETVYVSLAQSPQTFGVIAVRTKGSPMGVSGLVRAQVRALDKNQTISAVASMDELMDQQVGRRRLLATLLGSFALMALLLVLVGVYGLIAYTVAQRTQEIGVRRALGAQNVDILLLVLGQSLRLALTGVAIGVLAASALTRLLQSVLFEVSATDPLTFAIVVALFLTVVLLASYLPARRATRVHPLKALRV